MNIKPLFNLGNVVATANAIEQIPELSMLLAIEKYRLGDWGDIVEEDAEANNISVKTKGMIMGVYKHQDKTFWIITDPGHHTTTVLMPEDY